MQLADRTGQPPSRPMVAPPGPEPPARGHPVLGAQLPYENDSAPLQKTSRARSGRGGEPFIGAPWKLAGGQDLVM